MDSGDSQHAFSQELLDEIVRRIVHVADPERIILFGSAARGKMGPNSDLDILIVKRNLSNRRRLAGVIRRRLHGLEAAVDLILVTPKDVEEYRDCPYTVISPALRESRTLYAA